MNCIFSAIDSVIVASSFHFRESCFVTVAFVVVRFS